MVSRIFQPLIMISLCFAVVSAQNSPAGETRPLTGFDRQASDRQHTLEKQFDSLLKREELREWMKRLSARPHHLGSAYGKENADFIASLFRSWGFETEIERFDVLFPTPKTRLLEMT